MKKIIMILVAALILLGVTMTVVRAQEVRETDVACLTVQPLVYKMCIDGYEYTVVKQGCVIVGFTQAFEIYPKRSGKPKFMIPVACNEIEPIPVP